MNKYHILSVLSFIGGFALLGLGISQGQGKVYWVVIFPVFEGTGVLSFFGILLIIAGIFLLMISFASGSFEFVSPEELYNIASGEERYSQTHRQDRTEHRTRNYKQQHAKGMHEHHYAPHERRQPYQPQKRTTTKVKTGGILFIGPIPIIWGSDKRIGYIMAAVALVLVVVFLIYSLAWLV